MLIYPYVCVHPILIYGNLIIVFLRIMKFSVVLDSYSKLNLSTFDFENFCSMQFFNQCTEIVNSAKKSRSLLRELSVKIIH